MMSVIFMIYDIRRCGVVPVVWYGTPYTTRTVVCSGCVVCKVVCNTVCIVVRIGVYGGVYSGVVVMVVW